MEFERPPTLRTGPAEGAAGAPAAPPPGGPGVNEIAELVADLLAATGLLPADKLALVRGRAGSSGSIARAIVDEGVASTARVVPLHVLERIVAIPYAIENGYLRVAVADPANIHGIDELRLATRYPLELAVAPRDDVLAEIRRLVRASEAFGARAIIEAEEPVVEEQAEEPDDLEADDGISDAPLVRLVNSVIFQAAEDGASDIHFEPQ